MKKIIVILFSIILIACSFADEPRMINIKRLLLAYDFDDGIFYGTKDIHTVEDFICSVYFNPRSKEAQIDKIAIEEELPKNKEGALRVCALYLFKIAVNPAIKEEYLEYVQGVKRAVKKEKIYKYSDYTYVRKSITITDEEIKEYYLQAIHKEIYDIKIDKLLKKDVLNLKKLVYEYCIDPKPETFNAVLVYKNKLEENNSKITSEIAAFFNNISLEMMQLFYEDIGVRDNEKE